MRKKIITKWKEIFNFQKHCAYLLLDLKMFEIFCFIYFCHFVYQFESRNQFFLLRLNLDQTICK